MSHILSRPLTVADLKRISNEVPEWVSELGRMAAVQWKALHGKRKAAKRRKHVSRSAAA